MTKTLSELETDLEQARKEYSEAQDNLNKVYKKWEKAKDAELSQFDFSIDLFTPEFYKTYLSDFGNITSQHKMIERFYGSFDKRLRYGGGYHAEHLYPIARVAMKKGDTDVDNIVAGLKRINEMLEQDELYIDVFEHTLSEYGAYHMNWYHTKDDHCEIVRMTYGSPATLFEGTLRECLIKCGEKYYYD